MHLIGEESLIGEEKSNRLIEVISKTISIAKSNFHCSNKR